MLLIIWTGCIDFILVHPPQFDPPFPSSENTQFDLHFVSGSCFVQFVSALCLRQGSLFKQLMFGTQEIGAYLFLELSPQWFAGSCCRAFPNILDSWFNSTRRCACGRGASSKNICLRHRKWEPIFCWRCPRIGLRAHV